MHTTHASTKAVVDRLFDRHMHFTIYEGGLLEVRGQPSPDAINPELDSGFLIVNVMGP